MTSYQRSKKFSTEIESKYMTREQITIVQRTFRKIYGIADSSAEMFFSRLFELDASLQDYFDGDLQFYKKKFIQIVGAGVYGLNRPESIVPVLQQFSKRYARHGIRHHQYNTIGAALLWTLSQGLADDFTPDVMAAWAEAFNLLANVMKNTVESVTPVYMHAEAV